ncbi:MAG: Ppx/GppA phosphatase family protein, partial [Pseudomonadota bacterium]
MAETVPPGENKSAGKKRGGKSGKVADFRYKRSSQSGKSARARKDRERQNGGDRKRANARNAQSHQARPFENKPKDSGTLQRGPARHARPGEAYAALDLGTNNCRLLIARPSGKDFTVIDAFSRVVKLGEDLATTGRLSDEAMDRALGALSICADKLRRRKVRLARSVATEACRRAANGPAFIDRVHRETGIVLDIITAEEEARLAVLGCHILLEQGDGPAVIFDIGGGSTELVLLQPGGKIPRILDWQSVPWGVVSLTDTVGRGEDTEEARLARYREMRRVVSDSFAPFAERIADASKHEDIRLLGTSGTVTTLASLHLELPHYDRKAVDGLIVPSRSMREISEKLSRLSPAERSELP